MKPISKSLSGLLIVLLCAWSPAPPPGVSTLYAKTYQFDEDCTGSDMVFGWTITGYPAQTKFLHPWEPGDITIRGVWIVLISAPTGLQWLMLGENDPTGHGDGDALIFLPADRRDAKAFYPSNAAFQFPGANDREEGDYIDLHGSCTSGHATVMATFYYTRN